jgi:hypothetical protein
MNFSIILLGHNPITPRGNEKNSIMRDRRRFAGHEMYFSVLNILNHDKNEKLFVCVKKLDLKDFKNFNCAKLRVDFVV